MADFSVRFAVCANFRQKGKGDAFPFTVLGYYGLLCVSTIGCVLPVVYVDHLL